MVYAFHWLGLNATEMTNHKMIAIESDPVFHRRASGLSAMLVALSISFVLFAGSAMATSVTVTADNENNGSVSVQIHDTTHAPIENPVPASVINLATSIGALNVYCVDIFDYATPATYNMSALTTGSTFNNGASSQSWTATQINLLNALLYNGSLQSQSTINTAALQIAIWDVEYDTAATNGSYNITSTDGFYFSTTSDSNSGTTIAQAQTYLNDATGYQNGSNWVSSIWSVNSSYQVQYMTGSGVQNFVYLAAAASVPEPSTVGLMGVGLIGLWAVRRRKVRSA